MKNRQSGQTIVASLIVIAIIAILAVVLLGGTNGGKSPRADGKGGGPMSLTKLSAQDEVCRSNMGQLRSSIMIFRTNADDLPPAALAETGLSATYQSCPMGKEPYAYDPATGNVYCPHPGHEKF